MSSRPKLTCDVCGGQPAINCVFREQVGFVVARNLKTVHRSLCKYCAQSVGRRFQTKTVLTGWWGLLSAITNTWYVIENAIHLARAARLSAPVRAIELEILGPQPGRPIFKRWRFWIAPIGVLAVAIGAISDSSDSNQPKQLVPTWSPGYCIQKSDDGYVPVECSKRHEFIIVGTGGTPTDCNASTTPVHLDPRNGGYWICVQLSSSF